MNHQPDKFFRDKLHGFQKPAPSEAWQRISKNVGRQDRRGLWLRVAAAVLVLVTGTLLIYPSLTDRGGQLVSEEVPLQKNNPVVVPDPAKDNTPPNTGKTLAERATAPKEEKLRQPADPRKTVRKQMPAQANVTPKEEIQESPGLAESGFNAEDVATTDSVPNEHDAPIEQVAKDADQPKSRTIIFSAEEVNEKYLAKITEEEATSKEKESSGLRKLLDKAYDLKHNQDPLGDLRQKKNEILAMNFRNDKRTQND